MKTLADRFRHFYEHERDGNAKVLKMLESVPEERRASPDYQRAVDLMTHLINSRRMWLHLLGASADKPSGWFQDGTPLGELTALLARTEAAWTEYLAGVTDQDLARDFETVGPDGNRYRWRLEPALTQVNGHAWYHRGQICQLVKALGGTPISTDYIFWNPPTRLDP